MKLKILLSVLLSICTLCHAQEPLPFLQERILSFKHKYPDIHLYTPEEIAILAQKTQDKAAKDLTLVKPLRLVDAKLIGDALALLNGTNCKFFFRHGEQQVSDEIKTLPAPLQKIAMMRLPENETDPMTMESAVELLGTLVAIEYLHQKTGLQFQIETSKNRRASTVAAAIATLLDTKETQVDVWNCLNYPPEKTLSNEALLKILPDGTLPWNREKVDQVIGVGTYEKMTTEMKKELGKPNPAGAAFLAVTHTQQLNALQVLKGISALRVQNYGFLFTSDAKSTLFPSGFYHLENMTK